MLKIAKKLFGALGVGFFLTAQVTNALPFDISFTGFAQYINISPSLPGVPPVDTEGHYTLTISGLDTSMSDDDSSMIGYDDPNFGWFFGRCTVRLELDPIPNYRPEGFVLNLEMADVRQTPDSLVLFSAGNAVIDLDFPTGTIVDPNVLNPFQSGHATVGMWFTVLGELQYLSSRGEVLVNGASNVPDHTSCFSLLVIGLILLGILNKFYLSKNIG